MHLRYNNLLLFLVLALFLTVTERAAGHNFIDKVSCFECHEKLPLEGTDTILRTNIEKICMKCHSFENKLSHPVGIVPNAPVPLNMPLDREGRISCITCHDIHMQPVNKLTGKKTYYLRWASKGKKFCYACHGKIPL